MRLKSIVEYLDKEVNSNEYRDSSHNGLQVESPGQVKKICFGVDASLEFFQKAREAGADMVICHHGISWGDSLRRITEINYKRVSFLIKNDMALYACHLPLDAHPKYGNNIQICKALGLKKLKRFGEHGGTMIGYQGVFDKPMKYATFKNLVSKTMDAEIRTMDFGKKTVKSVAVVSGGAAMDVDDVGSQGIDVYLTGEPNLASYSVAHEWGVNVVFAGHYATEVYGVKALMGPLARKFKVKTEFIDLRIPF